jgi:isoleucyl-tRNA synthetase
LEVQDKITIEVSEENELVKSAVISFGEYIQAETQALELSLGTFSEGTVLDMDDFELMVKVEKA